MRSTIFTNKGSFGPLQPEFKEDFVSSTAVDITTGYVGYSLMKDFEAMMCDVDRCRMLIGMVYRDPRSLSSKCLGLLSDIDSRLRKKANRSGIYISDFEYHGKLYRFGGQEHTRIYIGSSNFSRQGFVDRHECTICVNEVELQRGLAEYIDYLFDHPLTLDLSSCDLDKESRKTNTLSDKQIATTLLAKCEIPIDQFPESIDSIGTCSILLRPDDQPQSSLNLFMGKGRLESSTNKYRPRPWYEVELQSLKKERENRYYPICVPNPINPKSNSRGGKFTAFMKSDGKAYRLNMKVFADGGKNIATAAESGGRVVLGKLIKDKLVKSGSLDYGGLITSETLENYGRSTIDLIKIDDQNYIIDFDV